MQISKYATYGIIVMQELRKAKTPMTQFQLADVAGVTIAYIQQVLLRLQRANLVSSVRGQNGGHVLADRKRRATVLDVHRAMSMASQDGGQRSDRFREVAAKTDNRILGLLGRMRIDKL